jgi:hypothetical protein
VKRAAAFLLPLLFASCVDQGPTAPSSLALDGPSLAANARSADAEYSFTTIDVPNARSTWANGINAGGAIVGEYVDAAGSTRGYLLRHGAFTMIDYPGAVLTQARGIGPGGDIVGTYRPPGEPALNFHGFLLTQQGEFVPVDFPGHISTIPQRILPDGTMLGCRHDWDFMETMRGIAISRSGNSEIDEFASMHNGATPDRRLIVGLWTNMMTGRGEAYVIEDGDFKSFVVPGSNFTAAWDVNPTGDIVGVYRDAAAGRFHGFVRSENDYVSVDVPGAVETRATGVNARGDVVGRFVLPDRTTHGFLARRNR